MQGTTLQCLPSFSAWAREEELEDAGGDCRHGARDPCRPVAGEAQTESETGKRLLSRSARRQRGAPGSLLAQELRALLPTRTEQAEGRPGAFQQSAACLPGRRERVRRSSEELLTQTTCAGARGPL